MFGLFKRVKQLEKTVSDHESRIGRLESWEGEAKNLLLSLPRFQVMTDRRLKEAMENILGLVRALENLEKEQQFKETEMRGKKVMKSKLIRHYYAAKSVYANRGETSR